MELDLESSVAIAQRYFGVTSTLIRLGWGISGYVYLSPDLRTAVKVHRSEETFLNELRAYRRLQELRIYEIHGLTIPKLRDFRHDLRLIQMDFVNAPYLLDFAGVSFRPPDFSDEVMEHWHAGIAEMFGPNAHLAYAVYHSLAKNGIYYMDFRPSNLNLTGLKGIEPTDPPIPDDPRP